MFIQIEYADIVYCQAVPDPSGRNPKRRRFVVINENVPGDKFKGVAITGTYDNSDSFTEWLPSGTLTAPHHQTGLTKSSAAICTWVPTLDKSLITNVIGYCPEPYLRKIMLKVNQDISYKKFIAEKMKQYEQPPTPLIGDTASVSPPP